VAKLKGAELKAFLKDLFDKITERRPIRQIGALTYSGRLYGKERHERGC
jgi:hypothetical protein